MLCATCGAGDNVAARQNSRDVMSPCAQLSRKLHVTSLYQNSADGEWKEVLVEDRSATPADLAASRLDFGDWLSRLPHRQPPAADR